MAFKVTDFKTNLVAGGGGARPSLFKIDINGSGDASGFSFSDDANILIVNTCGFMDTAREESVDVILEAGELRKFNQVEKLKGC